MEKERELAAVDTDFLLHLIETKISDMPILQIIQQLFDEMEILPIMHELVYKNELCDKQGQSISAESAAIKSLFEKEIIRIKELNTIVSFSPDAKKYYETYFSIIYQELGFGDVPVENLFSEWKAHASLGEVHTVVMCLLLPCALFLSDDSDSRTIADFVKTKFSFQITVYDRKDACSRAVELQRGESKLTRETRRRIAHR